MEASLKSPTADAGVRQGIKTRQSGSHLDFLRKENPWLASESSSLAASPSFFFRLNMRLNMLFGGFGGLPAACACAGTLRHRLNKSASAVAQQVPHSRQ